MEIADSIHDLEKACVREMILEEHKRPDGRKIDEIRPLSCEVGVLPRTHGSSIFTRGQTQVMSVVTLGMKSEEQMLDGIDEETEKDICINITSHHTQLEKQDHQEDQEEEK